VRQFWEVIISKQFDDRLWLRHFRMTKTAFEMLCNEISPVIQSHPLLAKSCEFVVVH